MTITEPVNAGAAADRAADADAAAVTGVDAIGTDLIDALAGIEPGDARDAARSRRPEARAHAQGSFGALFVPADAAHVSLAERAAVALFVARLHGERPAVEFYGALLRETGRDLGAGAGVALEPLIVAEAGRAAATGPYGEFRAETAPEPFDAARDRTEGPVYRVSSIEAAYALGDRLAAALEHAHLLVLHPRDASRGHLQALLDAGWSTTGVVTLSQLVAFLAFQLRVVRGLEALGGAGSRGPSGLAALAAAVARSAEARVGSASVAAVKGVAVGGAGIRGAAIGSAAASGVATASPVDDPAGADDPSGPGSDSSGSSGPGSDSDPSGLGSGTAVAVGLARGAERLPPAPRVTEPRCFTQEPLGWKPWLEPLPVADFTERHYEALVERDRVHMPYFRLLARDPEALRERTLTDLDIFFNADAGLPRAERELAAAAASRFNACVFCASVHSRFAVENGADRGQVQRLLDEGVSVRLAPRLDAIVDAAVALTETPSRFGPGEVAALRAAGLDELSLLDVIQAGAFFNWANRLMLSIGEPSE